MTSFPASGPSSKAGPEPLASATVSGRRSKLVRVAVVGLVLIFVNRETQRERAHPSTRRMEKVGALARGVADFETRTSRGKGDSALGGESVCFTPPSAAFRSLDTALFVGKYRAARDRNQRNAVRYRGSFREADYTPTEGISKRNGARRELSFMSGGRGYSPAHKDLVARSCSLTPRFVFE